MGKPGCLVYGPVLQDEVYEVPMYQLVDNCDWMQLMIMCEKYRMNHQVVHRTLDVFTLDFSVLEDYQMPNSKYAIRNKTPDTTYRNLQVCIDMIDGGFFNFVGGIMKAYDRDVAVTQKCVRVLYCMTTIIEYISRNITPYLQTVLNISKQGVDNPTGQTISTYRLIMIRYFNEKRPPSTMPTSGDRRLLFNTIIDVRDMIVGDPDDATPQVVEDVCEKILDNGMKNSKTIKNMGEDVIGMAIGTTVRWLRMSLESAQRTDNEHQILALRFLYQLLQQSQLKYPGIMLKHGLIEVLLMGIAKNNALANAILNGQVEDAADVMRNQFAFYDLMYFIFSSDLDFTGVMYDFCQFSAFEHVAATLQLAMHDACIFRFEFGPQRTKLYKNVLPGALVAPYKTRCDSITSTYNIAEMAVVLACRMCQHTLYGNIRPIPDPIFARNLQKFTRLNINEILLYGCRSFEDKDESLKIENHACSMDRDSFRQRGVSANHIYRLAESLDILQEYRGINVVNRSD
jgi:hypothetical protein